MEDNMIQEPSVAEEPTLTKGEAEPASTGEASPMPHRHLQELLELGAGGAHLLNGEDPDDYVRRLREGWG